MTNVYDDPAYTQVASRLHEELKEIRIKYKDSPELDQKFIDIYMSEEWYYAVQKQALFLIVIRRTKCQ